MHIRNLTALTALFAASAVATPVTMTIDQYDALLQAARTKANDAYNAFNADRSDYHKAYAWVYAGNEVTRIQNMDVIFAPPPVAITPPPQPKAPTITQQLTKAPVITYGNATPPTPIMQTNLTPAQRTPQPIAQAIPPKNGVDGKDGRDGKDGITTIRTIHSYTVDTATVAQVDTNSGNINHNSSAISHNAAAIEQDGQQIDQNHRDIDQNRQKIKKVGAMAQAIAGLHYDANNSGLAVAVGEYDGASSVAGGAQFRTTYRSAATVSVSWDGDAAGANVGWHMSF
ncbi:YadA C-terminal domain-containing protein [Leminorella grimontii]|uniref:YadA C-terminal domain-containing protein n=1 Tax=Leminorella grimontii TaxID=82981 RepID=UPI003220605F